MKKVALLLAIVMLFGTVLASCGEKESGGLTITTDNNTGAVESDTQIITGLLDESITIPTHVTKIAAVSPAAKIIFEALEAGDMLVDASAGPDVVFADEADAASYKDTVPVVTIPLASSIADINNLIRLAGKVSGKSSEELVNKVTNVMNVAQMGSSAYTTKFRVYLDLGDGKTVGSGTYISEMLYASGLENIATIEGFGEMTAEDVIAADPEFIFTVGSADDYLNDAAFAGVSAVVNGYVYELNADDIIYGSSNVSNAVSQMYEKVSETRGDE